MKSDIDITKDIKNLCKSEKLRLKFSKGKGKLRKLKTYINEDFSKNEIEKNHLLYNVLTELAFWFLKEDFKVIKIFRPSSIEGYPISHRFFIEYEYPHVPKMD